MLRSVVGALAANMMMLVQCNSALLHKWSAVVVPLFPDRLILRFQ